MLWRLSVSPETFGLELTVQQGDVMAIDESKEEFEQRLKIIERDMRTELAWLMEDRKAFAENLIRLQIEHERLDRRWQLCEKEKARLLTGIDFVTKMMRQERADFQQLAAAVEEHFGNPELAELLKVAHGCAMTSRARSGGAKKLKTNLKAIAMQEEKIRIHSCWSKYSRDERNKWGWQKAFVSKMTVGQENPPKDPTIRAWCQFWEKEENKIISAST
jgi:hypothetical protein